jgi:antitoxin StbD
MQQLHATQTASITELKKNPSKLIHAANGQPIVILNHNIAAAYLIPAETFETMLACLDEAELKKTVQKRLNDGKKSIPVSLDDL